MKTDELQVHEDIESIKDVLDPSDEKKLESLQTSFTDASNKSGEQLAATHQRWEKFQIPNLFQNYWMLRFAKPKAVWNDS